MIVPESYSDELIAQWSAANPYEAPLTAEERARRAQFNRPRRRVLRWFRDLRWIVHDRLFPECREYDE